MAPIDVALCLGNREITEPRRSRDGKTVAYIETVDGTSTFVFHDRATGIPRPLDGGAAPRAGRGFGGGCFDWLANGSDIVFAALDGTLRIAATDGSAEHVIAGEPGDGRSRQAPNASPDGGLIAYVVDQAEIWVTEVEGGDSRRVGTGDHQFCFDPAWSDDGRAVVWQAWNPPHMPWDQSSLVIGGLGDPSILVIGAENVQMQQPRFAPTAELAHVSDEAGFLNVCVGGEPITEAYEHAGPTWGLGQRSFDVAPNGREVAFCRNEAGFGRLCVHDRSSRTTRDVARGVHGSLQWTAGGLLALRSGARTPTQLVDYDTSTWQGRVLAVGPHPGWTGTDLVEPESFPTSAPDGTTLPSRIYLAQPSSGRLLCWVHGGPTDQWQVTFIPRVAFWVSRGWNVLVPDHRGSTGHGRAHQQALRGQWGVLDVSDVAAAVAGAHRRGWGTPSTTVMMGASAGGFTALGVVGRHRRLACGAVVSYPVSDLVALARGTHRFEAHYNDSLVGPLPTDAAAWVERSPLSFASGINVPLLVFHGADDPIVPLSQSRALVDAVRAGGGDAELVVYPAEGHGFRLAAHQRDEYQRTGAFLDRVSD